MLCEVPLTKEQQAFATDHHGLVYKFLNENHLPEDEFYDVVVFAYLKAVKDYFNSPSAQKFSFSTIATRQMKFRLYDYFRTQIPFLPMTQSCSSWKWIFFSTSWPAESLSSKWILCI